MTMEHVFAILEVMGVSAADFFARALTGERSAEWKKEEREYLQNLEDMVDRMVEKKLRGATKPA